MKDKMLAFRGNRLALIVLTAFVAFLFAYEDDGLMANTVYSDEYYYDNLPDKYKAAYREIYSGFMSGDDSGSMSTKIATDDFWTSYYSVLADHPELFWVGSGAEVQSDKESGMVKYYDFEMIVPEDERDSMLQQLEASADTIISNIDQNGTEYEMVQAVYDYIIDTTVYDTESIDNQCIQSVLLNHASVGAGYSKAFQYLLNRMGLPCIYMTGVTNDGRYVAWNIVNIDGEYYHVDTAWGDPDSTSSGSDGGLSLTNYAYLCCTDDDIYKTRTPDIDVVSPKCMDDKYDYYRMNNLYYDNFDYDTIYGLLMDSVHNDEKGISLRFGTQEAYDTAVYEFFTNRMYYDADQYLMEKYDVPTWNNKYFADDDLRVITIQWLDNTENEDEFDSGSSIKDEEEDLENSNQKNSWETYQENSYAKEITFQDYSWGEDVVSIARSMNESYFNSVTPGWSDASDLMQYSTNSLGYWIFTYGDREIAGYPVANYKMYFTYGHDANGKITTDAEKSELYLVSMNFEVVDVLGTYQDLYDKLTSIYGEGATDSYSSTIYSTDGTYDYTKTYTEWRGANDTGIMLTKCVPEEAAPESADWSENYVVLSYGKTNSDETIEALYPEYRQYQAEQEQGNRDPSNTSGL